MSDVNDFALFHGKPPTRRRTVDFHVPKHLVILGKAKAIEYLCSKKAGGGDGRNAIYRHEFTTPMYLCMDEKRGKQLYIIGGRLKVTAAGVEN